MQYRTWFLDAWSTSEMQTLPTVAAQLVLVVQREVAITRSWNNTQPSCLAYTNTSPQPAVVVVAVVSNNNQSKSVSLFPLL